MPKLVENAEEKILNAAKEELKENGLDALKMRSIASRCSLAVGTIYHYFPEKFSLINALVKQDWAAIYQELSKKIVTCSTLDEVISMIYQSIMDFRKQEKEIFQNVKVNDFPEFYSREHVFFSNDIITLIEHSVNHLGLKASKENIHMAAISLIAAVKEKDIHEKTIVRAVEGIIKED